MSPHTADAAGAAAPSDAPQQKNPFPEFQVICVVPPTLTERDSILFTLHTEWRLSMSSSLQDVRFWHIRQIATCYFQVVVLAGGSGSRLSSLLDSHGSAGAVSCKALLPVANRPMIWYCLRNLQEATFGGASRRSLFLRKCCTSWNAVG